MRKKIFLLFISIILANCSNDSDDNTNQVSCQMEFQNLGITESSSTISVDLFPWLTEEVAWGVKYSNDVLELSYGYNCGDECSMDYYFMFDINDTCISFDYAYNVSTDFGTYMYHNVYLNNSTFKLDVQEWIPNEKFVGRLLENNDDGATEYNFYTQFNNDDYFDTSSIDYLSFEGCMDTILPYNIDINSDGQADFSFDSSEELVQNMNQLAYTETTIYFKSLNETSNKIMINSSFEDFHFSSNILPVNSESFTEETTSGDFGYYADFVSDTPYPFQQYNYLGFDYLNGYEDDYIMIKMQMDGAWHYGYVRFNMSINGCSLNIIETYLNPVPNEHFIID